ncbi:MAG: glycine cleavage system protein GcvH [Nitrospirae bacterium]|nr:glycine cleavage system protein GcvH [Candidatus Troglogloeales bacterium]
MTIEPTLWYHKEHEWVKVTGTKALLGISDFAQDALGDIVYLELPKVGVNVKAGTEITEIESTKTTSPMYAPISGKIVSVNETLKERPELINKDPYGEGWIAVIEMADPKEVEKLMTASAYETFLQKEEH